VIKELKGVENLIYFGTYPNETSALAKIVIPSKSFLEKSDVRLSYSDYSIKAMHPIIDNPNALSEYEFTQALYRRLGFEGLQEEQYYLTHWLDQGIDGVSPEAKNMLEFDEFEFIDELDDEFENIRNLTDIKKIKEEMVESDYWLITPKAKHSINSQFVRSHDIEVHSILGFKEGQEIEVSSEYGAVEGVVKINDDLRSDCIAIGANVEGVNRLTPPIVSDEGESACYQEIKVKIQ